MKRTKEFLVLGVGGKPQTKTTHNHVVEGFGNSIHMSAQFREGFEPGSTEEIPYGCWVQCTVCKYKVIYHHFFIPTHLFLAFPIFSKFLGQSAGSFLLNCFCQLDQLFLLSV